MPQQFCLDTSRPKQCLFSGRAWKCAEANAQSGEAFQAGGKGRAGTGCERPFQVRQGPGKHVFRSASLLENPLLLRANIHTHVYIHIIKYLYTFICVLIDICIYAHTDTHVELCAPSPASGDASSATTAWNGTSSSAPRPSAGPSIPEGTWHGSPFERAVHGMKQPHFRI